MIHGTNLTQQSRDTDPLSNSPNLCCCDVYQKNVSARSIYLCEAVNKCSLVETAFLLLVTVSMVQHSSIPLIHSIMHPFHSFIHSFIHSLIHACILQFRTFLAGSFLHLSFLLFSSLIIFSFFYQFIYKVLYEVKYSLCLLHFLFFACILHLRHLSFILELANIYSNSFPRSYKIFYNKQKSLLTFDDCSIRTL